MSDEASTVAPRPGSFGDVVGYRSWRWPVFFSVATIGALTGGAFLLVAIQRGSALLGLAGASIATVAAWWTTEYTASRWHDADERLSTRPWYRRLADPWRAVIVAALVLSAATLTAAEVIRSPTVGFVGLMLLAMGSGPALNAIHSGTPSFPRRWTGAGALLAAIGVPVTLTASGAIGLGLVGAGLLATGRGLAGDERPETVGWLAAGLAAAFLATGLLGDIDALCGLGAVATLVALMGLAADVIDDTADRTSRIGIPVVGGVLVVLAGWFVWVGGVAGDSPGFLLFVIATIALAGASVVWRTAVVFGAVVVGFVFVWGITASTVGDPNGVSGPGDQRPPDATAGVVALGDSYISGEGADEFYEGSDQKGGERNECRRAPTAYPALLALGVGKGPQPVVDGLTEPGLDFVACSGAVTANIAPPDDGDDAQRVADRLDRLPCRPDLDRVLASYPCGADDVYGWDRQLDALGGDRSATQLVLLSIGGNDARFGEVVAGCLYPGSCSERREVWLDRLDALGLRLEDTYRSVRDAFVDADDDGPAIVVMPYPFVMTEERCTRSPFLESEHEFVVEFATALNQQIEAAAARAGVNYFAPGAFSFVGHRVCEEGPPAINLIDLQPTDGPLFDRLSPTSWTHNSIHPDELGHRLIAERLAAWLDDEQLLAPDRPGNPDPVDPADADPAVLGLQTARTFAIDPATATALRDSLSLGSNCDPDVIDTFAARIQVFDEATEDARSPAPRVPLSGADPTAVVCATDSDGTWQVLRANGADGATPVEGRPRVRLESDGTLFLRGGRPADTCIEPAADSEVCRYQWVLYSSAPGDPDDTDADAVTAREAARTWQLLAIDYCTVDPSCADSIDEWSADQLAAAAVLVVPAAVVVFLGGWMLALGLALNRRRVLARLDSLITVVGHR